jgi:DNA-binding transcriptional regulator YiaG
MTSFAHQLKSEISRLAKKEIRSEISQLKKASANYRSEIASLKRKISTLETSIKRLSKNNGPQKEESKEDLSGSLRFRADGFTTLRKKYEMSAGQMGQLIGVSAQSIYAWETGKTRPRTSQLLAIASIRKLSKKQAWEKLGS